MSEKAITNQIMGWLTRRGAWVLKAAAGPYQRPGVPDLLVCFEGQMVALEVKKPGGKPTKLQLRELDKLRKAGAVAAVVESLDEVQEIFRRM